MAISLYLICLIIFGKTIAQTSTTTNVVDDSGCTVVNNYNYYGPSNGEYDNTSPAVGADAVQGPPGKRGPRGEKGNSGQKGEPGENARSDIIAEHLPASCNELPNTGKSVGYYWIAPQPGLVAPIYVLCNFTSDHVYTTIGHKSMKEIAAENCEEPGCYKHDVKYSASMDQILSVIETSQHCRQFIKFRCIAAVLLYSEHKEPYGYWMSRSGNKMLYWGGATSKRDRYCACGETGTCHNSELKCNCDHNALPELSDEGYLEDKDTLPVSQVRFGDMGADSEFGWHTLGPLECW